MNTLIDQERALWLHNLRLDRGGHDNQDRFCVMEAVAYFAGEPWSDHPQCASPLLTDFGLAVNDTIGADKRQQLIPLIPRIVGTRGDGLDEARRYLALDWLIRTFTPPWLRLIPAPPAAALAAEIALFPPIVDFESGLWIDLFRGNRFPAARSRRAVDALETSCAMAAWATTGSAPPAGIAPLGSWAIVWDSVCAAAHERTDAELAPTVIAMQDSAIDLFRRMINPTPVGA